MPSLLLDERICADGSHAKTWASIASDRIAIRDDDGTGGELSVAALDKVMGRYGRAVDPATRVDGETLDLPGGFRLGRFRHHAPVDATGRDYLVWHRPGGEEPLAVIATMATAALRYLVLRLTDRSDLPDDKPSETPHGKTAPQETETDP